MTDYIDRKAFIEDIKAEITNLKLNGWKGTPRPCDELYGFIDRIKEQPADDVAPVVHGRWIEDHDYLKCPKCGVMVEWDFTFFDIGNWNYCPNCGAKMDKGDKDDV